MTGTGVPVFEDRSIAIRPVKAAGLYVQMALAMQQLEELSDLTIRHPGHASEGGLARPCIACFPVEMAPDTEGHSESRGAEVSIILDLL